ncbi:MAG: C40 family peptidase [Bacteroides sp.]|nr:C40 family peptidase [Bacteroides sp.]MBD5378157.1 C40 family peptidase [Bacteroides sp.]
MKKYIKALVSGIAALTLFAISPAVKAEPVPAQTPASHTILTTPDLSDLFVEQAYENARLNSPFASFTAQAVEVPFKSASLADKMVSYASKFLGTRYRRGATGPSAFDCSGFTSYVFRNFGITLSRTSSSQYKQGTKVNVKNLRPGDLLFFSCHSSGRGNVGHVAMVASVDKENGTCEFIHASVKRGVTYQKFPDGGYYDRHFIGAKRVLD